MSTAIEQLIDLAQENLDSLKESHRVPGTDHYDSPEIDAWIRYEQRVIAEAGHEIGQHWTQQMAQGSVSDLNLEQFEEPEPHELANEPQLPPNRHVREDRDE